MTSMRQISVTYSLANSAILIWSIIFSMKIIGVESCEMQEWLKIGQEIDWGVPIFDVKFGTCN